MGKNTVVPEARGHVERAAKLYPVQDFTDLEPVLALHLSSTGKVARLVNWLFVALAQGLEESGSFLRGYSFRQSQTDWLLVVRVTSEGIPLVAFVSGSHPLHCISLFQAMVEREGAVWYPDQFA